MTTQSKAALIAYFETNDVPTAAQFVDVFDTMGDASVMSTVAKNLAGGINEVDALIGTAASSSGTIGTSIDTDGTLKAGAVDGAGVIADSLIAGVNVAFDSQNRHFAPTTSPIFGKVRWQWPTGGTVIDPDASNPFGTPTVRHNPTVMTNFGKKLHLADMKVRIGDRMSFGILCKVPTGRTSKLGITWRTSADDSIASETSANVVGADAITFMIISGQTVPDTATNVDLYSSAVSGAGDVDIYAWYAVPGPMIHSLVQAGDAIAGEIGLNMQLSGFLGQNLAFDGHNRYYAPSASAQDGKTRWYTSANLAQISPDAANPFGLPTIRNASGSGGKKLHFDEMGIKVGDRISLRILAKIASGRNVRVAIAWRTAADAVVSTAVGETATGDGSTFSMELIDQIVPATATNVDVYINDVSGEGDVDIYAWYISTGNFSRVGALDGQRALSWVQAAAGSMSSLDARLDVAINEDGTLKSGSIPENPYNAATVAYGKHLFKNLYAQYGKILNGDTAQAVIAWVGDSWVDADYRFVTPNRNILQAVYGNAGPGYCSGATTAYLPDGVTRARVGTWTDHDWSTTPKGYGPDIRDHGTTDFATPASCTFTATGNSVILYYLIQPDGGAFEWWIDAGSKTAVATAGTLALGTVTISGQTTASHVLHVEYSTAGTAGIIIMGADVRLDANGVRMHKLGASGSKASDWNAHPDATILQAALAALAPQAMLLTLGTNDMVANVVPATFTVSMETLMTTLAGAVATADLAYVTPADNGSVTTYPMQNYVDGLRQSAVDNGFACFDCLLLLGTYAGANSRGLYDNSVHINDVAGHVIARNLCRLLLDM